MTWLTSNIQDLIIENDTKKKKTYLRQILLGAIKYFLFLISCSREDVSHYVIVDAQLDLRPRPSSSESASGQTPTLAAAVAVRSGAGRSGEAE